MIKVNGHLTRTERDMLRILSDGELHLREELHTCLTDELGDLKTIKFHIYNLRRKIPDGYLIVFQQHPQTRKYCYRLVRRIKSANTGRL
jgi:DNA-binding response OmpR family regulator